MYPFSNPSHPSRGLLQHLISHGNKNAHYRPLTITVLSSLQKTRLQTKIKQFVSFLQLKKIINLCLLFFLFLPLLPFLPFSFSHKHKTILSYPEQAWENHKENDKRPEKSQRNGVKVRVGQRSWREKVGRKEGGRNWENERKQAEGKERRKQVFLSKQNMRTESDVVFREGARKERNGDCSK